MMILHPDGRIEGTPEEIRKYKNLSTPESCRDEERDDSEERLKKAFAVEGPATTFEGLAREIFAAKTPIPGSVTPVTHLPKHDCNCMSCKRSTIVLL